MRFRILLSILLGISFLGCNNYKIITVPLSQEDNTKHSFGVTHYAISPLEIELDSLNTATLNKLHIKPLGIYLFDYDDKQPGLEPTYEYISKTMFIIGQREDSIFVIADANTNNRLDDDSVIFIDKKVLNLQSTSNNLQTLPLVHLRNLRVQDKGHWYTFSKKFYVRPIPQNKNFEKPKLALLSTEYRAGNFRYKGKRKYVRLSSSGYFTTNLEWVNVSIVGAKNKSNVNLKVPELYHIKDTVFLGKNAFVIDKVSALLDTLILKPIPAE